MGVNHDGMIDFQKALEQLQADIPEIMNKIVVAEGMYAVKQARTLCTERKVVNEGTLRRNYKCGTKAIRTGVFFKIDVYNNLDYAYHVEYGFRKHFVPGKYLSGHWRTDFPNGLVVGAKLGYVPGKYILRDAIANTKRSQNARVERKYIAEIKRRDLGKFMG